MLKFLAKKIIELYKPTIVAVLSFDSEFDPSAASLNALSKKFIVAKKSVEVRNADDVIGGILNIESNQSSINKFFAALRWLASKKNDYPEIILLDISNQWALKEMRSLADFLKFNFLIILPRSSKKDIIDRENINFFLAHNSKLILKSSDKNTYDFLKKKREVLTYSSSQSDIFASDMQLQSNSGIKGAARCGISFKINYKGSLLPVRINYSVNEKEVCNVLIATLLGLEVGMNLVEIASSFSEYRPVNSMRVLNGIKRSVIIDNSDNYNYDSAFTALDHFEKIKAGRKVLVAGDILGLGVQQEDLHRELARKIFEQGPDLVFCAGSRANFIFEELKRLNFHCDRLYKFDSANEVEKILQPKIQEDDLILISGSKEIGLDLVVRQIMANPPLAGRSL
ncbi:hypothetical protein KKB43_03440 [Patescibacteria group bacterium]|nr:hypothetical protein [Patescibacteria group bacterium]MBU4580045.1 hypothetical protein [Patescibacteria group bacterium]